MTDPHPLRTAFRHGDNDAVSRTAEREIQRARSAGDAQGEVEGLYALARVALRAGKLEQAGRLAERALRVAQRNGRPELGERPLHVLAAVARTSGDHVRALDLYKASIELNQVLGQDAHVHAEQHNLAMTELHLGNVERARQLIAESRERVFRAAYHDFLPYLGIAEAALASADGDHDLAARLIGFACQAFAALGQVPDPDDARELDMVRERTVAALGPEKFESERATGTSWSVQEALGRTFS